MVTQCDFIYIQKREVKKLRLSQLVLPIPVREIYVYSVLNVKKMFVGSMEGAVEAGERAAREVLCAMGKISPQEAHPISHPEPSQRLTTFQSWLPTVPMFLTCYSSCCCSGWHYIETLFKISLLQFHRRFLNACICPVPSHSWSLHHL